MAVCNDPYDVKTLIQVLTYVDISLLRSLYGIDDACPNRSTFFFID